MAHKAYLSLGSNLGDRAANLREAIGRLRDLGEVTAVSSLYETEPVEFTSQPWFLNCAVTLQTNLPPEQLLAAVLDIEQQMGRQRIAPKGPRMIDLDILLLDNRVVDAPGLQIPHPAMHLRRFVLEPLAEIAPRARHPLFSKTAAELLAELEDGSVVRRLPEPVRL